MKTRIFSRAQ